MKIKHTIWASVKHVSAKLRPFFCQDQSAWSCLRHARQRSDKNAQRVPTHRAGWREGQRENAFRRTLHTTNPRHVTVWQLTTTTAYSEVWLIDAWGKVTQVTILRAHVSNNKLNGSHKSTFSYSSLVTGDSPLMWICSYTKWDLNTEQHSIFCDHVQALWEIFPLPTHNFVITNMHSYCTHINLWEGSHELTLSFKYPNVNLQCMPVSH